MGQQVDYAKLAAQHGGETVAQPPTTVDYAALAREAGAGTTTPAGAQPTTPAPKSMWDSAIDTLSELQSLNPMSYVRAASQATYHPIDTLKSVLGAQGVPLARAEQAFKEGDYTRGVAHTLYWLLPLIGPRMSDAGEDMTQGEYAKGLGKTLDVGLQIAGPAAVSQLRKVSVPGLSGTNLTATEQAAVDFGNKRGVPLDAATANGRPIVAIGQKRVSDTMGGAGVAEKFKAGQAQALTRVGGELATQTHPTMIDPVGAGTEVRGAVQGRIQQLHGEATRAYEQLRQIEASAPAQTLPTTPGAPPQAMKLAVDLKPARTQLQPLYDSLLRERELVGTLQGGKARALVALDTLMRGPEYAPLSVVDGALGELKSMARGAEMPELRNGGQSTAAEAVKYLDAQVRATATQAGPNVIGALEKGRAATVAKYQAADVLDTLSTEPRKVFDMLTTRKDGAITRLRALEKETPAELPKIGRAYLEDLLQRATADGSFKHADALYAEWQKLGDETKGLIFKDPKLVANLDSYFLLAKRIAQNPNPSGTARVMTFFNIGSTVPAYALARLFYSPTGVALLKRGLSVPVSSQAARAAYLAEVTKATGEAGMLRPALAADTQERKGSR